MTDKELQIRLKRIEMTLDLEPIPGVDEETVKDKMESIHCGLETALKLCKEECIKAWFKNQMAEIKK